MDLETSIYENVFFNKEWFTFITQSHNGERSKDKLFLEGILTIFGHLEVGGKDKGWVLCCEVVILSVQFLIQILILDIISHYTITYRTLTKTREDLTTRSRLLLRLRRIFGETLQQTSQNLIQRSKQTDYGDSVLIFLSHLSSTKLIY